MAPKIRAGCYEELVKPSGEWLFIDIGFSSRKESCGFLKALLPEDNGCPGELRFDQLVNRVIEVAKAPCSSPLNMMIEAPLSVAFNHAGNPAHRSADLREGKGPQGWWYNAGAITMIAAGRLLRKISECEAEREVRLFEGFLSSEKSHAKVVRKLRRAVLASKGSKPQDLKRCGSDCLESAFSDIYCGIPPIVKVDESGSTHPSVFRDP